MAVMSRLLGSREALYVGHTVPSKSTVGLTQETWHVAAKARRNSAVVAILSPPRPSKVAVPPDKVSRPQRRSQPQTSREKKLSERGQETVVEEQPGSVLAGGVGSHEFGEGADCSGAAVEGGLGKEGRKEVSQLVLMRHGESMWNHLKLFTGDVDIPLTERGILEAMAGGKAVAAIDFDVIFTSRLVRSKQTALIAMTQNKHCAVPVIVRGGFHGHGKVGDENRLRLRDAAAQALQQAECRMVPVYADKALNERCYGDLQGLNKEAAIIEYGDALVREWRRSSDTRPPNGESLKDTWNRSIDFFELTIKPQLAEGKNVLIAAHGNVLRCIISHLSGLTVSEMLRLQIVTALPYSYSYDGSSFAECCVLRPSEPITVSSELPSQLPAGLTSVLKRKGDADSLI